MGCLSYDAPRRKGKASCLEVSRRDEETAGTPEVGKSKFLWGG